MSFQWLTLLEFLMDEEDGRNAPIDQEKPCFIIVEAKRSSTLKDYSSEAELIGQLKCQIIRTYISSPLMPFCYSSILHFLLVVCWLTVRGTTTHYGALTDGRDWRFYIIDDDAYFVKSISADSRANIVLILGRCPNFLATFNSRYPYPLMCRLFSCA
jgi:hypothetical protein